MLPWFLRQQKYRSVLVIGLDNAGKTSILCHLANVAKANKGVVDRVETAPTIGVQMVEFRRQNVHWVAWDMSGQGRYRDIWPLHASRVNGVIFVVDVTDGARMAVARDELSGILASKALRRSSAPIAILANKYDVMTSSSTGIYTPSQAHWVTLDNVCVALGLDDVQAQCPARVFATSALTRQGIEEAMDWLSLHTNAS
ncbi:unnamed protein product [Ascophyllum nodosum]